MSNVKDFLRRKDIVITPQRYLIEALGAMAQGLFASLLIGTIIKTLGQTAHMVPGNRGNIKVTTPEDVYIMRALLQYQENEEAFGLATNLGSKINSAKRRSKRGNHHA